MFKKKKKEIPNCAICKWLVKGYGSPTCSAIGDSFTTVVHNTRLCKNLFQRKETR
jgi:hypothetical protein